MEVVLLNSGGLDSLAAAVQLRVIDPDVVIHSLYVSAGQANDASAKVAAQEIADAECASHSVITLEGMTYDDPDRELPRLPYRTTLYHIMGAIKCRQLGARYLAAGIDVFFSEYFGKQFSALLAEETSAPFTVIPLHPIRTMSRPERVALVKEHPLASKVVSCEYPTPCGECSKCLN